MPQQDLEPMYCRTICSSKLSVRQNRQFVKAVSSSKPSVRAIGALCGAHQ